MMSHGAAFQPRGQRSPASFSLNNTPNRPSPGMAQPSSMEAARRRRISKSGYFQNHAGMPSLSNDVAGPTASISTIESSQAQSWPPQSNIERFYSSSDGPWNVLRATFDGMPSPPTPYHGFYQPANVPPECDRATYESDSGYATKLSDTQSAFGEPDRNHESRNIRDGFMGYHPGGGEATYPPKTEPQQTWPKPAPARTQGAQKGEGRLICPTCQSPVKTRSELNKHEQRHTKPHLCTIPNCTRAGKGFSTPNDLDRHLKSVHPDIVGRSGYVCHHGQCHTKVKFWPRADNFRAHLSRIHHMAVTVDYDIEMYFKKEQLSEFLKSQAPEEAEAGADYPPLESPDSSMPAPSMWTPADQKPLGLDSSRTMAPQGDCPMDLAYVSGHIPDTGMGAFGSPQPLDQNLGQDVLMEMEPIPQTTMELDHISLPLEEVGESSSPIKTLEEDHQYVQMDNVLKDPSIISSKALRDDPGQAIGTTEKIIRESSPTEEKAMPECRSLSAEAAPSNTKEQSNGDTDVQSQGSPESSDPSLLSPSPELKVDEDEVKMSDASNSDVPSNPSGIDDIDPKEDEESALIYLQKLQNQGILEKLYRKVGVPGKKGSPPESTASNHPCPDCHKGFGRRCELRKHMKRHAKPYFCTFPRCFKKFGSKNDWKRHENSQHFQLEVWKCDGTDGNSCGKVCHRRETFKNHILKEHNIGSDGAEAKLEVCRIGRTGEARFWCGFCCRIVDFKHNGGEAWTERFDHIDAHICGKDGYHAQSIEHWVSVDPDAIPGANGGTGLDQSADSQGQGLNAASLMAKSLKRSLEDGAGEHTAKKVKTTGVKGDANTLWTCCQCSMAVLNIKTTPTCLSDSCHHHRCENCFKQTVEAAALDSPVPTP